MLEYHKGNIFNSKCQTLVNTVNCFGIMGKGIALVYKLRYPNMYSQYQEHCRTGAIDIGRLWIYRGESNAPWVLNFPTKLHWKQPSKVDYLEKGLQKFLKTYKMQGITSIAFPLLGAHNGGLEKSVVVELMTSYLAQCDIKIEIYEYDTTVPDDLFNLFRKNWFQQEVGNLKVATGIRRDRINAIGEVLSTSEVNTMIGLINTKGIGLKTIERCFKFVMGRGPSQPSLFD